jgi:putative tryptophan/tyrosine transport system substrate-binding protein
MRRREFIGLLGRSAVAWPLAARAQPMLVVGYLHPAWAVPPYLLTILRKTLSEAGYVEGRSLAVEYRFAEGQYDRLPALAAELVRRHVTVIIALNTPAAVAAKAATATIPIVFSSADDPVKLGLVASLSRPGENVTGAYYFNTELGAKQLGLLRELVPRATRFGFLVNPDNVNAQAMTNDVTAAASAIGVQIEVVRASDRPGLESAFATLIRNKADALLVGADPFFFSRRAEFATLAKRHALPAIYNARDYPEVGGMMSYGTSLTEVYRQVAVYAVHILKGDKPADLPVVQSTKFDFVINLVTAKALGLEIPPMLLARADEVIE